MYLIDRTTYERGWEFRMIQRSRLTFGDPFIEGDEPSLTEVCWHQERYFALNPFPDSDSFEAKYLYVDIGDGEPKREGVGIILRKTSAVWIPKGHIVYAVIAEYDPFKKAWNEARNPA